MTLWQRIDDILGRFAFWRHSKGRTLTKKQLKGHIDFALKDAAKLYKCRVDELEYKVNKNQQIHIRKKKI
ncbi:MAG: hypothetical protein WC356_02770 [Candidatus Micrarchaeia archaeon]|jgi:hypothetical protein